MKRWPIIGLIVLLIAAGGAWLWLRSGNPLSQANRLLATGNTRGAELVLRNAVLAHPQDARLHYALAEVELRRQDPAAGEREARAAMADGWDAKAVNVLLAEATLQQQRYDEVLRDYQPDPAMTPAQAAMILVQRGLAQSALNRPEDAAASVADAQRRDPRSYAAALAAAQIARARHDPAEARRQVDLALSITPNDPAALLLRSALMVSAGDLQGALDTDNLAVAQSGGAPLPLLTRADLLIAMGNTTRARQDVDQALKVAPDNPLANFMLAQLLVQNRDWPAADAALQKADPILDRLPRANLYVALVKANVQQPQQALDAAEQYLAKAGSGDAAAVRLVAAVETKIGRPELATALLEPRVQDGHVDARTLQVLAGAYWQSGKPQLALQTLEQAARLAPGDASVLTQLAASRMGQGNVSGAALDLQQALDLKPTPALGGLTNANLSQNAATADTPTAADTAIALVKASVRAGEVARAEAALQRLRHMSGVAPAQIDELQGLVSLAKLDTPGARTAFEAAAKAQPDNIAAQVELARVIALQGDSAQAAQMLTRLADQHPTNDVVLSSLEVVLLGEGKQDQAIARFVSAHAAAPADLGITMALAGLYSRAGNNVQALAVLNAPVPATSQQSAAPPQLLEMRAALQMQMKQPKDAAATWRQLLTQHPNNPVVTQQLANALVTAGDVDGARSALHDALAANPGNPGLLTSTVGIAVSQGGLSAGLAMADQLAADKANLPAAATLKGDLLMSRQRQADALAAYQAAYQRAPSSPLAIRIALAEQALGNAQAAQAGLRDWLGTHPADPDAAQVLASYDIAAKRYDQARAELQTVLQRRPDDVAALNNLAVVDQQSSDLSQARELAQRAYLLQSTPQTEDTLGWIVLQQGDARGALPLLRQAAAGLKDDPGVQYHLAAALQRAGQPADAKAILQSLDARPGSFPEKPDADKLLATLSH